jgi:hypothetical protein
VRPRAREDAERARCECLPVRGPDPGTDDIDESILAVPFMSTGARPAFSCSQSWG